MKKIPLLVPDLPRADALLPYLRRIDEARWHTNFGPLVRELEVRVLKELLPGAARPLHVTTVSNCTAGLELALLAFKLPLKSRVLVPALTFVASATAIVRAGCEPVIADVDPERWTLTPEIARKAMRDCSFSAVMPVAAFGAPHSTDDWDAFSNETGLPVLLDAAGAMGNQSVGAAGAVAFSLHATKALGAGECGLVVSSDSALIEKIRRLSNFGIDISNSLVTDVGTNAKVSEYQAVVALAALDAWPEKRRRRIDVWHKYAELLVVHGVEFQEKPKNGIYSMMPVRLPAGADAGIVAGGLRRRGIETRRWYQPLLFEHPAFCGFHRAGDLANVRALAKRLLGLPFYPQMEPQAMAFVANCLGEELGNPGKG